MITNKFIKTAESNIKLCRPGDWEHAKRVVYWVKRLAPKYLKEKELIIKAAYIHDIGWRGIFPKSKKLISEKELLQFEPIANRNTRRLVTEFLKSFNHKTGDIQFILQIINAADKHKSSNKQEAIMVDADNLSKLNIDHLREKYEPESWRAIYKLFVKVFPDRFKTKLAKEIYTEMFLKLKKQIDKYQPKSIL